METIELFNFFLILKLLLIVNNLANTQFVGRAFRIS